MTAIERVTDPLAFRAVTSTEVLPSPAGVRVTTLPFTVAVTTPVLGDRASIGTPAGVKASATSTSTATPPTEREIGARVPTASGAGGAAAATVTDIERVTDPLAFRAVTSTEVLPRAHRGKGDDASVHRRGHDPRVEGSGLYRDARGGEAAATSTSTAAPPAVREIGASVPTATGAGGAAAATATAIERGTDRSRCAQ